MSAAQAGADNCQLRTTDTALTTKAQVDGFTPEMRTCLWERSRQPYVSLRHFQLNGIDTRLVVNPETLETAVAPSSCFTQCTEFSSHTGSSAYVRGLRMTSEPPYPLADDGLVKSLVAPSAIFLTVDLCPSGHKAHFEKRFFDFLIGNSPHPAAVAVSISGGWLEGEGSLPAHLDEFRWLQNENIKGQLKVTWVNHSLTHPYNSRPGVTEAHNFLLEPGVNFDREVLGVEKMLLEHGAVPSVFFRFPGLVSDRQFVLRLAELGLIPLGTSAWIAKGQPIQPGAIVLVHGNGNEGRGITTLINELKSNLHWLSSTEDVLHALQ